MFLLNLTNYLTVLLFTTLVVGDYLVLHSVVGLYKALFDNTTHALVGGLSWLIVAINNRHSNLVYTLYEVFFCAILASIIDLDHFVAAKSFHLKDATQLKHRPPLHSSTFPFLISVGLFLLACYWLRSWLLLRVACIVWVAFATHHTRDAYRHGFWFSPFGSSPPLPYLLYIAITLLIPYLMMYLLNSSEIVKIRTIYFQPSSIVQHF